MFSTPLICSSMGATTVEATTSALAPGYWPLTLITGGAISGYCATGRRENATMPRITKTIETTEAKIGRSMKKCDMRMDARPRLFRSLGSARGTGRRSAGLLRGHLHAGARLHQTADDHAVFRPDAVLDDALAVRHKLAERDVFLPRRVLAIDHQHVFADLLGADCQVRHQQRLVRLRGRHAHAREHAGREHAVGIGKDRASADGASRAVDDVVDEIHRAFVREVLLVDELELDLDADAAAGDVAAKLGQALVAQERCFVEGELEADRIDGDDCGEQRGVAGGAAGDQVAGRDTAVADAAVDLRPEFGELEIELGLADRRLGVAHRGLRVAIGLRALLEGLLGNGLVAHELLAAREVRFGIGEVRARLHQAGARLVEHVLERPLVDGEQEIALLDDLTVLEMHAVEIAGDAATHLDRIDRDETADIFIRVGDGALGRLGDGDGRGPPCCGGCPQLATKVAKVSAPARRKSDAAEDDARTEAFITGLETELIGGRVTYRSEAFMSTAPVPQRRKSA